jgi:hypothetical protein
MRLRLLKPLATFVASLPDFFFNVLVSSCTTFALSWLHAWTDPFAYKDTINDMILWKPHAASRSNWVTKTGLPFDPLESAAVLQHQDLICPKCEAAVSPRESANFRKTSRVLRTPSIHDRYRNGLCSTKLLLCMPFLHVRCNEGETCRGQANHRSDCAPVA